ncbi:MAG: LuxR C-terminal-related transcriptional regulator [Bryobacteraceae bacterium]
MREPVNTEGRISKAVVVIDTQPVTIEGLRSLLRDTPDLKLVAATTSLSGGLDVVRQHNPAVVMIDKGFGFASIVDWIANLKSLGLPTLAVVWGVSMNEAEALRIVQAGAQGVIRKSTGAGQIVECLRRVAGGSNFMEDALFHQGQRTRSARTNLTPREQQVAELVEQGLKNKEIARVMGIRPGTVKIHLKHIFEKTGVRGRYGLALSGLKEKGLLSYPPV